MNYELPLLPSSLTSLLPSDFSGSSPLVSLAPPSSPWLGILLPDFPRETEFPDGEVEPVEEPKEDENEQPGELGGRKQRRKRTKGLSFATEDVLDKFKKVSQLKFSK